MPGFFLIWDYAHMHILYIYILLYIYRDESVIFLHTYKYMFSSSSPQIHYVLGKPNKRHDNHKKP